MEINKLMNRAFSNCMVVGNEVHFLGNFSREELIAIYDRFSTDLLDYQIPHYRVVGIYYMSALGGSSSVLRSHDGYSMSIIELGTVAGNIIPNQMGGNDRSKGCVLSTAEVSAMREEGMEVLDIGVPHCLRVHSSTVGQLVCNHMGDSDMRQSSLDWLQYYQGDGTDDPGIEKPEFLLDDFLISKIKKLPSSECTVFFYKKGKGIADFDDNAKLFTLESDIFPCRTIYDLSSYFMIKYPTDEVNKITLMLRENINSRVLENILREYGGEFSVD